MVRPARSKLSATDVNPLWTLASNGLLWIVRGATHGPRADVVQLAVSAWAPDFVGLSVFKELPPAIAQGNRNGAVVSLGDERQYPQNGGDGRDVDYRFCFRLIL